MRGNENRWRDMRRYMADKKVVARTHVSSVRGRPWQIAHRQSINYPESLYDLREYVQRYRNFTATDCSKHGAR
eukprot:202952-Pyramimonas_sp.AAC.1